MLQINNKEYKVLDSEIKSVDATYNTQIGYSFLVSLDFELNNDKGYISFYVDFFDTQNFENIENKKYKEIPTKSNSKITMIEVFDTQDFIDFIDSEVNLNFGRIENNQVQMKLNIDDHLIRIDYDGLLNIK